MLNTSGGSHMLQQIRALCLSGEPALVVMLLVLSGQILDLTYMM